jgi:hypothetical protein
MVIHSELGTHLRGLVVQVVLKDLGQISILKIYSLLLAAQEVHGEDEEAQARFKRKSWLEKTLKFRRRYRLWMLQRACRRISTSIPWFNARPALARG